MKRNLKLKMLILIGILAALTVFVVPVSAQNPSCSNKWFEIGYNHAVAGPILSPGKHKIWIGQKDVKKGTISNWRSFGAFQINQGNEYLATITNGVVNLSSGSPSAKYAFIKYFSKDEGKQYAVCTQLIP